MESTEKNGTWDELSSVYKSCILGTLKKDRLWVLKAIQQLVSSDMIPKGDLDEVSMVLLSTYNYYSDTDSRNEVVNTLETIVLADKARYLKAFINYVFEHSTKAAISTAITDHLTLLGWINKLGELSDNVDEELLAKVVTSQGLLLSVCIEGSFHEKKSYHHLKRVRKSVVTSTKTSIQHIVLLNEQHTENIIRILTNPKSTLGVGATLCYIGALSVALEAIIALKPSLWEIFTSFLKKDIIEYFTNYVILGKPLLSRSSLEVFGPFVTNVLNKSDIEHFMPSFEKAILRSSEYSFVILLPTFFSFTSEKVKLCDFPKSKFFTSIIGSLKGIKPNVREGAYETLKSILSKHVTTEENNFQDVIDEIFKAFKTSSNSDVKCILADALVEVDCKEKKVLEHLLTSLTSVLPKNQNETVLKHLVKPFLIYYLSSFSAEYELSPEIVKAVQDQVSSGLKEKKLPLRAVWSNELGEGIYRSGITNGSMKDFMHSIFPDLLISFNEAVSSPLPMVTNKGISSSFICIYIYSLLKNEFDDNKQHHDIISKAIHSKDGGRTPFLTDYKIFSKLRTSDEIAWLTRALECLSEDVEILNESEKSAFGFSWIYFILCKKTDVAVRLDMVSGITNATSNAGLPFAACILSATYDFLKKENNAELETNGFDLKYLAPIFVALTHIKRTLIVNDILVKLFVCSHHPQIKYKNGWIGLVQKCGVDVGELIESKFHELLQEALLWSTSTHHTGIYDACVSCIGTLAFIKPEIASPEIAQHIRNDLSSERFSHISDSEVRIWQGKEGKLVINVLDNKSIKVEDKNSKDYETKKWEESIKKELAAKGRATKKLTKDEQILVEQQLNHESKIRNKISSIVKEAKFALDIIDELVNQSMQVETGMEHWLSAAVNSVLPLTKAKSAYILLDCRPNSTFLHMAETLTARLGNMKLAVGSSILRLNKSLGIEEKFLQEPLLELISRVLFRVKFLSDQNPLPTTSFAYILPLLEKVLENGRINAVKNDGSKATTSEFVDEDPEEEQLLLAMEIISLHSGELEKEPESRPDILEQIISLMKLPSKMKVARDCFRQICSAMPVDIHHPDLTVLLKNIICPEVHVKVSILEIIESEFELSDIGDAATRQNEFEIAKFYFSPELWIAVHDNDEKVAQLAQAIWSENDLGVPKECLQHLLTFGNNDNAGMRLSIAKSITTSIVDNSINDSSFFNEAVDQLIETFFIRKTPPPVYDKYGLLVKSKTQKDFWEERSTIALAIKHLAANFTEKSIVRFFKFLLNEKALEDKEDLVSQELQEAGVEIIKSKGYEHIEILLPLFENILTLDGKNSTDDKIKESTIIFYGALGRHLDPSDPRLEKIVEKLLETLDTPSEDVQYAISECISPLLKGLKKNVGTYLETLTDKLFTDSSLAIRRGAAYGIAALVKGAGIKVLSDFEIIRTLTDAADDKKNPKRRESVAFTFECLSQILSKFFEPFVIEILPILLNLLGDANIEVREASDSAAKQIMKNTTSFGVKKLIPLAISNLDETSWRSKKGSVELLGSMAYLDPAQLSASLSTIIPEIVSVLNDSHKEVRKAADQSLKRFGEVIRNPEIQKIVPDLIKAIGDPTKYTNDALEKLIKTQFVHYIDGPSLALIIHVIHRGMRERSASVKKNACQIVGNMAILVDAKDLKPYLPSIVKELEVAMVDPVPTTRSTAARALGSLVEKLGEKEFPDLIDRLLDTLQDESKAGDRLGSAQALSEVVCGLGIDRLESLLPFILKSASSPRHHIRAGFMPLLLFLPVCFGISFSPYLSKIIPPILSGLADSDEDIRDTALRAGRLIVKNYAKKAVDLLLPELEIGMSDSNYRIRVSSVELTGYLLFQITNISGKNELTDDQATYSGEVNKLLLESLGQERCDRVLAMLFVCRSDVNGVVRNASVEIWKVLVANTPRTIKEILSTLTSIVITKLASEDDVQRTIAAQTLGETVRRVGGNALAQLLPTFQSYLDSEDENSKQGICIALSELIKSSQNEALDNYQQNFIEIIRQTLTDSSPEVRYSSAQAFEALHEKLGKIVIDEIIPNLLQMLETDDSENALLALKDIMSTKSDIIFPILLPTLLAPPMDSFKAKALASLASVAESALFKRISTVINAMLNGVLGSKNEPEEVQNEIKNAFDQILLSVDDESGVHPLMSQLMALVKNEDSAKRACIYERISVFCAKSSLDYSLYLPDMVSQFITSLGDRSEEVVKGAFNALTALVKRQSGDTFGKLVKPAAQSLNITGVKGEILYAFTLPRGPNCVLPIFLHGLMYGSSDQKELSALAIADIIDRTPPENLKPCATMVAGPLIRVIGEKVTSDIKAAILVALNNLLSKIPQFLRPFIPQLQRTFIRSLSDVQNSSLRDRAVFALGTLIDFQPRVDALVTELVTGAKTTTDKGVKTSMLEAMLIVVTKSGKNMSDTSKASIMNLVEEEIMSVDDKSAIAYAKLLGSLSNILSVDEAYEIVKTKILEKENNHDKFCILSVNSFLRYSPHHIFNSGLTSSIAQFIIEASNSLNSYISDNAAVAIGKFLLLAGETKSPRSEFEVESQPFEIPDNIKEDLVSQLAKLSLIPNSNSPDTRRLALVVIRTLCRFKHSEVVEDHLNVLVPSVFSCVRDNVIPIKLAAEKSYLALFHLVGDKNMTTFHNWLGEQSNIVDVRGREIQVRSLTDYTKRVASRLAGIERERITAGGDAETMFSDHIEDENEIWAVGGVDVNIENE